ncbi:PASTA domain-containing protein [Amycolatopsis pithecellobii]|uniref:PASTA domain-containing protein n=1 Tax=Amycolatopsis pithecellobii TaxID=664692 RepID=A0A6N7Z3P4_9PSEU|nr:PASTA domain-containing protein [Amycolatopsis pithecellobii]MTD55789.1 PASTA domain-containing protein [Amycolatopsis pithecellobii]
MSEDPWLEAQQAWRRLAGIRGTAADGEGALSALSDLGLVRRLVDQAEFEAVRTARTHGKSWSEIAVRLGVARQSAWERWRDVDEPQEQALAVATKDPAGRRRRGKQLVPNVIGMTKEVATSVLAEHDLVLVVPNQPAYSEGGPERVIVDQSPEAGAKVPAGTPVTVWLSNGGGGSGVREPRRPKPDPKTGRKMRDELTDETVN